MKSLSSVVVAAGLVLAAAAPARADQLGPLRFDVPSGFSITKRTSTAIDMRGPKGAVISIRTGLRGSEALAVARAVLPAEASNELKEVAIQVAGRAGHLVVRRADNRSYASAACVPSLGNAVAIVMGAPPAAYKESCVPWGALVDGGRIVEEDAAPAPAPQPAPRAQPQPQQPVVRQPARHWVELRNIADWGQATVYWDGQQYVLAPGSAQKVEATAGTHAFKWQNPDGSWGENRFEVPRFNLFKGSCPKPRVQEPAPARPNAQPAPQPQEQPIATEEEYREGARWYLNLYCLAIFFTREMDEWTFKPENVHKEATVNAIVGAMKKLPDFAKFCFSIPGFWQQSCDKWKNANADQRYAIRREAAQFLRSAEPDQWPIPADDGEGGDELDRLLRKQSREYRQAVLERRQAELSNYVTSSMVGNYIFANTSAAMSFTPVSW